MIFVTGIVTYIQATWGCRLPIVQVICYEILFCVHSVLNRINESNNSFVHLLTQGGTISFLVPVLAILSLPQWKCPSPDTIRSMSADDKTELWQTRMREISGAIAVSAVFQLVIGVTGFVGKLLKIITPLTIVPTVSLVGLTLFAHAGETASKHWGIAVGYVCCCHRCCVQWFVRLKCQLFSIVFVLYSSTTLMLTLFSQVLVNIQFPYVVYRKGDGLQIRTFALFRLFPVNSYYLAIKNVAFDKNNNL